MSLNVGRLSELWCQTSSFLGVEAQGVCGESPCSPPASDPWQLRIHGSFGSMAASDPWQLRIHGAPGQILSAVACIREGRAASLRIRPEKLL
jgi:hypothetical protein